MQREWRILFTHVEVWRAKAPNFNTGTNASTMFSSETSQSSKWYNDDKAMAG